MDSNHSHGCRGGSPWPPLEKNQNQGWRSKPGVATEGHPYKSSLNDSGSILPPESTTPTRFTSAGTL